jgi:hypothetical protein
MCIKKLLIMALIFAIVASPMTYGITRDIFGSWVASPSGCASGGGVVLHAAVFAGVLYVLWKLSKKKARGGYTREKMSMQRKPKKMHSGMHGGMHGNVMM